MQNRSNQNSNTSGRLFEIPRDQMDDRLAQLLVERSLANYGIYPPRQEEAKNPEGYHPQDHRDETQSMRNLENELVDHVEALQTRTGQNFEAPRGNNRAVNEGPNGIDPVAIQFAYASLLMCELLVFVQLYMRFPRAFINPEADGESFVDMFIVLSLVYLIRPSYNTFVSWMDNIGIPMDTRGNANQRQSTSQLGSNSNDTFSRNLRNAFGSGRANYAPSSGNASQRR